MRVNLKREETQVFKSVKVGFSWTTLFFGFFPAAIRGDWKWSLLMLLASSITLGLSNFAFPFFYNKLYIRDLLESGYKPMDQESRMLLTSKGIIR
ncbi:hypothetical protein ACPA0F_18695 [Solibacillus silvestris]